MAGCIYDREVFDDNNDDKDEEDDNHKDDKDSNDADKVDGRGGALRWAAVGGEKSYAVGCLPGRGGWVSATTFFDNTTNLWSDEFLAGRGTTAQHTSTAFFVRNKKCGFLTPPTRNEPPRANLLAFL